MEEGKETRDQGFILKPLRDTERNQLFSMQYFCFMGLSLHVYKTESDCVIQLSREVGGGDPVNILNQPKIIVWNH